MGATWKSESRARKTWFASLSRCIQRFERFKPCVGECTHSRNICCLPLPDHYFLYFWARLRAAPLVRLRVDPKSKDFPKKNTQEFKCFPPVRIISPQEETFSPDLLHGSLFSGIGGIDLGLTWAGFETAWQVEIDPFANKILEKHRPSVHRYHDVRSVGKHNRKAVNIISGGSPCQDTSIAGKKAG